MADINFDKRLLPIITASGYPPMGYWVPMEDRKQPLPPPDTLPPETSYHLWLAKLCLDTQPKRILEIGTRLGSSIIAMLMNCNASAVCIDIFMDNSRQELEKNLTEFELLPRAVIMTGDSMQLLPSVMAAYCPDLVHIDGDHNYHVVLHDLTAAANADPPPDRIVMHDLINKPTVAAWDCWHSFQAKRWEWNASIYHDIHNYPGLLERKQ